MGRERGIGAIAYFMRAYHEYKNKWILFSFSGKFRFSSSICFPLNWHLLLIWIWKKEEIENEMEEEMQVKLQVLNETVNKTQNTQRTKLKLNEWINEWSKTAGEHQQQKQETKAKWCINEHIKQTNSFV